MRKRDVALAIIIILSLIIGGLFGFYFYLNKTGQTSPLTSYFSNSGTGLFGFFGTKKPTTVSNSPNLSASSTNNAPTTNEGVVIPYLRHIYFLPVSGADFVTRDIYATSSEPTNLSTSTKPAIKKTPKSIGKIEIIRFVDRATGRIIETASTTLNLYRVDNTTVPKVYEALFVNDGNSVIYRGLLGLSDVITSQFGKLQVTSSTSTDQDLILNDLPLNITNISVSPTKDQVFYISNSGYRGTVSNPNGSLKVPAFNTPLKEWISQWPSKNIITLTTKSSGTAPGFMYFLNPQTKSYFKILGYVDGLTTLTSPDTNKVLYSQSIDNNLKLWLLDRKTGISRELFNTTLPEKCVWANKTPDLAYCAVPESIPGGMYPDAWYQSLIGFTDDIWSINTKTGESRLILKPSNVIANTSLDIINPVLSKNDDYLMFMNKADLSLWGYMITPPVVATSTATTTKKVK